MNRITWLYDRIKENESLYIDIRKHIIYYMKNIKEQGTSCEFNFMEIIRSIINSRTNGNLALMQDENKILWNIFIYEYFKDRWDEC